MATQVLDETAGMHNSTKHLPLQMAISASPRMSAESTQVKFQDPIESESVFIGFYVHHLLFMKRIILDIFCVAVTADEKF